VINYKPPSWFRSLQIGIGIIALVLSFLMITLGYPTLSLNIINIFVSITLLTIGIERVVSGLMLPAIARQSMGITKIGRFTSIGMGTIASIFAIIALSSPQFASTKNFTLLSLSRSVIFNGFGKIVQGVLDRRDTSSYSISCWTCRPIWHDFSYSHSIHSSHSLRNANDFFRNYWEASIAKNFEKIVCCE
jgi:hypothetical protein